VFRPAQLEIGRLWHIGSITVAQEHYATAVTQLVMAQLYKYIFEPQRPRLGTLVAACVGGELHDMGLRMITDLLEMDGWRTHFLGASTPTQSLTDAVSRHEADVLILSAAMASRVPDVAALIERLRADVRTARVPVVVGGYAFDVAPSLSVAVGADAYAADAAAASATALGLMTSEGERP